MNIIFKKYSFYSILLTLVFGIMSCGGSDDEEIETGLFPVTPSELESQPSFVYTNTVTNKSTYLWFRNGIMTISIDGSKESYKYSINDKKLTIETVGTIITRTYNGYIVKAVGRRKTQLYIANGLDGTNLGNLPDKVMNDYDYSSVDMSK